MEFAYIGDAVKNMDQGAVFSIVNGARPPQNYLFNTILPERNMISFDVKSGSMRIIPTMAGLVGRDSPYPTGGVIDVKTFLEKTAKLALNVGLSEDAQIRMYEMLRYLQASGQPTQQYIVDTVLNLANLVHAQAHLDTMEWLRGQALVTHAIDWTFNKIDLQVDYQIDPKYRLAERTGNDGYGGSASKFWTDIRAAQTLLRHQVRLWVGHPDTIGMIIDNSVNSLEVVNQDSINGTFDLVRIKGTSERRDTDTRYRVRLAAYGAEGEILDPDAPGKTIKVPFMPTGKLLAVGSGSRRGFEIGAAAVDQGAQVSDQPSLGYTHLAPTVEGKLQPGRWARAYTPEGQPWRFETDSVTNGIPVLQSDDQLVVLSTEMV